MARYHDLHNLYLSSTGGTSAPSMDIPAILAVGEKERVKGRDLMTAIFLDFELTGRFVDCLKARSIMNRGFHFSLLSNFVMALVAGRLLGLNDKQMANAMGIAGSQGIALRILDAEGEQYDQTRNIAWGLASQRGYLAALLARRGFIGPLRVSRVITASFSQ